MPDKALHALLKRKMKEFTDAYFETAPENRFLALIEQGPETFPKLLSVLHEDDEEARIDALLALGQLFHRHGPTIESLDAVVLHLKVLHDVGISAERQAGLFAIGNAGNASLIDGFAPLLDADDNAKAQNVACYVMGYARHGPAVAKLNALVQRNDPRTICAAVWALGQIGHREGLASLLPVLKRGEHLSWVIGAIGDIGEPETLKMLAPMLQTEDTEVRLRLLLAIQSIVAQNKQDLLGNAEWLLPTLRKFSQDALPPVAVLSMLILADLGQKLSQTDVEKALRIPPRPAKKNTSRPWRGAV